jgi:cytosine permease
MTRDWKSVAGAWLGVGTSPSALLVGAGIAAQHGGPIPIVAMFGGMFLIFVLIWFQGHLGLQPPLGDGGNLTQVASHYFNPRMQKLLGALIAFGMTGWFGLNVGFGAAAFGALINQPQWFGVILMGVPILFLSLRGLKGWNILASVTTICVLILTGLIVARYGATAMPLTLNLAPPMLMLGDVAVIMGFVSVFMVRAPDFTARLGTQRDLLIVGLMLCVPLSMTILAGANLQQGTGSADLVSVLAGSSGLAIGNLLITVASIAPTFTTLYSGAPALRAATGVDETRGMFAMGVIGIVLAIFRIDQVMLPWLSVLAATLPPILIPLAVESVRRRAGHSAREVSVWLWLSGAVVAVALTLARHPLASLAGLSASGIATGVWHWRKIN